MIENHISCNLQNERFSESSKKNVRSFKVWIDPLLFTKILLKTAQLFSKHFPPGISLCILYFLFHKGRDTSPIRQPSIHHLVYVFPHFLSFS